MWYFKVKGDMGMEKVRERSPNVELLEKRCENCEKDTQHQCSVWHPNDAEILNRFNARTTVVVCTECGGSTMEIQFIDGVLLQ